jgi:hypothetical protein
MASFGSCKNACHLFCDGKGKSKYKNRDGLFPFVLSGSSMQAIMVLALLGGVQRSSGLSLQTSEEQTKLLFKQVFNTVGLLPFSNPLHSVVLTNYIELL